MTVWVGLLVVGTVVVAMLARRQRERPVVPSDDNDDNDNDDNDDALEAIAPTAEGFVLACRGPVSLKSGTLRVRGRLQVFVAAGSQYATWRQFPQAIRYEVRDPAGHSTLTPDLSLSISDASETYDAWASQPADQIVGTDFKRDLYAMLVGERGAPDGLVSKPGRYGLRAHYLGFRSNQVEIDVVD